MKPEITQIPDIIVPLNRSEQAMLDPTYEEQLLEWVGMVVLNSPRVRSDSIDRYLCRYDLPEASHAEKSPPPKAQSLVRLRWKGFSSANFVVRTWLIPKVALQLGDHWYALSAATFGNASYTVLCAGSRDVLVWECG
jgi:ribonuclease P/MRP protein subunit RPP40